MKSDFNKNWIFWQIILGTFIVLTCSILLDIKDLILKTFFLEVPFLQRTVNTSTWKEFIANEVIDAITQKSPLYSYGLSFTKDQESQEQYAAILRQEGADEENNDRDADVSEPQSDDKKQEENSEKINEENKESEENEGNVIEGNNIKDGENEGNGELENRDEFNGELPVKKVELPFEKMVESEELLGEFYSVDASTVPDEKILYLDNLLGRNMTLHTTSASPQILIYHTHSMEGYVDTVEGNLDTTIVGVGEYLTKILDNEYGYGVLHHTGQYDVENRDYAYSNALPEIEKILEENPSIEVVIDMHRDAVSKDRHLVYEEGGKTAAKIMFFNGLSYTKSLGKIDYLPNPYLEDNLAFSFQMQCVCNEYFPGFARKIYLKGYRYNMHLRPKTLLVEVGAQTNTLDEAKNACELLAKALHSILSGGEP